MLNALLARSWLRDRTAPALLDHSVVFSSPDAELDMEAGGISLLIQAASDLQSTRVSAPMLYMRKLTDDFVFQYVTGLETHRSLV